MEKRLESYGSHSLKGAKAFQGDGMSRIANLQNDGVLPNMRRADITIGWQPTCECDAEVKPAVVLDPFAGAGTTGLVADRLGRDAILIEISAEYAEMARKRIYDDAPLFACVE